MTSDKRIAVLLSGGVDSSVAVYELVRQGLHPDCFYIKIAPSGDDDEWDCSMEEDLEMAQAVARKYGCSLEVVDCNQEYWQQVTSYTMEKVRQGLTPNPDVMCNRLIKFGAFHQKRGHDYDLIATGHYAQTEEEESGEWKEESGEWKENSGKWKEESGKWKEDSGKWKEDSGKWKEADEIENRKSVNRKLKWLCTAPDPVKDQTDFLAQIEQWQLEKAIFPIGHYMKDEVRRIAEREHLVSAHRRDSQGICFLGKIDYNDYLRRYLGEQKGDVVELETGRRIGTHQGHWFHTIGQRKGLGLGGGPWFVVKKDIGQNILYVSHGYDPQTAYSQHFLIRAFHSLNGVMPPTQVTIKIRHTPEWHAATLEPAEEPGAYVVHSSVPLHGVAPGQFCVVYDDRHHRCYGSAEIALK